MEDWLNIVKEASALNIIKTKCLYISIYILYGGYLCRDFKQTNLHSWIRL